MKQKVHGKNYPRLWACPVVWSMCPVMLNGKQLFPLPTAVNYSFLHSGLQPHLAQVSADWCLLSQSLSLYVLRSCYVWKVLLPCSHLSALTLTNCMLHPYPLSLEGRGWMKTSRAGLSEEQLCLRPKHCVFDLLLFSFIPGFLMNSC